MGNTAERKDKTERLFRGGVFYKHPSTIWDPINTEIVARIIKGILQRGDKITSIAETADKFNCSKSTAQKVLDSLCDENILSKIHGKGYYVNYDIAERMDALEESYMSELEEILNRYISRAKKIGMGKDEILRMVQNNL